MKRIAVLCDFDDTAADQNVAHLLLAQFAGGRDRQHNDAMRSNSISFREYQERAFDETTGSLEEMTQHVANSATLRPGFVESVAAAKRVRATFTVVSAGLEFYISAALKKAKMADLPIVAVRAARSSPTGPLRYDYGTVSNACDMKWATCKCRSVEEAKAAGLFTVFVGDGTRSDACAAAKADVVFARDRLLEHCIANKIQCTPLGTTLYPLEDFLKSSPASLSRATQPTSQRQSTTR